MPSPRRFSALALVLLCWASAARPQTPPAKPSNQPLKEVASDIDLSDPKKKPDSLVFLEAATSDDTGRLQALTGLIRREFYRQALLIAARDEMGLVTRDGAIGELPPDDLAALTNRLRVEAQFALGRPHELTIACGPDAASRVLWKAEAASPAVVYQEPLEALVAAESLARGGFLTALRRAGLRGTANPIDAKAAVPDDAAKLLGQMTFTGQFTAARILHETLRNKGESPATLGALSRVYANLAMLTDTQWGAMPWVFKARGLLYAERLRQRDPKSPWGCWHRAYAAALAGMHAEALDDLKTAQANRGDAPVPEWAELVGALCRFDSKKLKAASAKDGPLADTAAVFHFLTVENNKQANRTLEIGEATLKQVPECYRVHNALAETGGVSAQHSTTLAGFAVMSKTFAVRVGEMPDVPEKIADAVRTSATEPDLVKALLDSGKSRDDRREPSWAALGYFAREERVVQVYHRLVFLRLMLSVPADDFIDSIKPLVGDHPLYPYLDSFRLNRERDRFEIERRVRNLKIPELSYRHHLLLSALAGQGPAEKTRYINYGFWHGDNLYYDMYLSLRELKPDHDAAARYAQRMLSHSPYAPMARAALIMRDWDNVKAQAADWEKESQHPEVLLALGRRALSENRLDDAERCIGKALEMSPDLGGFRLLADAYKKMGDTDKWLATLERVLKVPDAGLEHARVRVDIANHFMAKKDFTKAKPYADAAAETYAAWAMVCAGTCAEGLKEWGEAEKWMQRVTERYDDHPQVWFFWCARTRRGDLPAAQAALEDYMKRVGPPTSMRNLMLAAVLHLVNGEREKAADRLVAAHALNKLDLFILAAGLEYDALGDAAKRDKCLGQLAAKSPYEPAVRLLRGKLEKGEKEFPTPEEAQAAIEQMPRAWHGDGRYLVARFLLNRDRSEQAVALLCQSADEVVSPYLLAPVLAGLTLRELEKKK
jgi:tetratricopeptide (TPR) repeat protein